MDEFDDIIDDMFDTEFSQEQLSQSQPVIKCPDCGATIINGICMMECYLIEV
mgnify:CR=1 FL=1